MMASTSGKPWSSQQPT